MADLGPMYGLFHFHYREVEQSTSSVTHRGRISNKDLANPGRSS